MGRVKVSEEVEKIQTEKEVQTSVRKAVVGFDEETMNYFRSEMDIDIVKTYKTLKEVGRLPADKLFDRDVLSEAINECHHNSRLANLIYLKAKAEREYFRIEFARDMRELQREATETVDAWLKANKSRKQATKDMIEQEMASNDELKEQYKYLIQRQEELRGIRDDCKLLATEWAERKWTLRTQVSLITSEREVKLS